MHPGGACLQAPGCVRFWAAGILLIALYTKGLCQLTKPLAVDNRGELEENKFHTRQADLDKDHKRGATTEDDEEEDSIKHCYQNIHLRWMTEVSSSVYSTPLITDLFSDGRKDVIVPGFVHYLEVLEAPDGAKALGWPAFHKSTVQTSPFLYDIDRDGVQDIGIVTFNGEVLFFTDTGSKLPQYLFLPKLKLKKGWYEGLKEDPIDHSNPDIGDDTNPFAQQTKDTRAGKGSDAVEGSNQSQDVDPTIIQRRKLTQEASKDMNLENEHKLTHEAEDSFHVVEGDEFWDDGKGMYHADYSFSDQHLANFYSDYAFNDYHNGGYARDDLWASEDFEGPPGEKSSGEHVFVDAHVLATPTVADIDQDEADELIISVSYFFDRDYYDNPEHKGELGEEINPANYIASAIVVFDLQHKVLKWTQHLDLTTDRTTFRAYLFSAPTVVDVNGDGYLEIVVGTSEGFLYVLDHQGNALPGWPIQMAAIEGQALVADLNGDGEIEIFAGDTRGSVALFDIHGKEIWERHLRSLVSQAATCGDVDGDGNLEIVLGTASGYIYVLDGKTGDDKSPFPFRTHGRIMSSVLITRLHDAPSQQLVVTSFDGYLYVIDGETGCVDVVDIGETSYSMVLADDLNDDSKLELVVSTMNGNVYMFETGADYHPMKTWTSQVQCTNGLMAQHTMAGIFALEESRMKRDIRGDNLEVSFAIVDHRQPLEERRVPPKNEKDTGVVMTTSHGPYNVTVMLKGVGVKEMNAGGAPVIGVMETYVKPGTYTVLVPCPRSRATATIYLQMSDRHKLTFSDEFSLSFHMHWYKLIKWLLALPFLAMAFTVVAIKAPWPETFLPS